ncbi:Na+/H+ antiporter subunit E [Deinococcus cavernae]|uniref:Na+/H+ antiporter subunit E n=1 Tax=Deinococcus cavernae TaxID=2320857 RepID=A0A418V050_9DEIO|nr:Na+/H+ antiporter subunit E [Deinococcus cavernae]RJF69102.1 Na+/H+ antiporter subunit E [Deinococcus cavernae]
MKGLALNVLLAIVWALFSGEVSLRELVIGFLLGYALLNMFPDALGTRTYQRTSFALLRFAGLFIRELTLANVQVALLALHPRPNLKPMVFKVNLQPHTDTTLTLLVATVTLMPGSVVLGFSPDRHEMYVHAIGLDNTRAARESIHRVESALSAFLPTPSLKEAT